jgi:hypothetical protein
LAACVQIGQILGDFQQASDTRGIIIGAGMYLSLLVGAGAGVDAGPVAEMVDMRPQHHQALRRLGRHGQARQHITPGATFLLQSDDGREADIWKRHAGDRGAAVKRVLERLQRLTSAAQEPIGHIICDGQSADAGASESGIER